MSALKTHWKQDRTNTAEHLIQQSLVRLSREVYAKAECHPDEKQAKKLYATATALQSRAALTRALAGLKEHPELTQAVQDFDRDPYILTTPSGTVDLRTGKIQKPNPNDLCSMRTVVGPEAGTPARWFAFLDETLGGDSDAITYLQRYLGYASTGLNMEKILLYIYGEKDSGKSVFNTVTSRILGDYHSNIPHGSLLAATGNRHPADLASFVSARLATSSEVPGRNERWRADVVKAITGGDLLSVRGMRENFREVKPTCKMILYGNHVPSTGGHDPAMWRRIAFMPFLNSVPLAEQDKNLADTLVETEGPRILNWMVEGARQYLAHGLGEFPVVVKQATAEYVESEDLLGQFVEEACVLGEGFEDTRKNLFQAWRGWCVARGDKSEVGTQTAFTRMLNSDGKRFGLEPTRIGANSLRGFAGIQVRPMEFEDEPDISPEKVSKARVTSRT